MTRRLRQHVNPRKLSSLAPREGPLALPDGPAVEVELGCGDAQFLLDLARARPDALFVGIDIRAPFIAEAERTRALLEVANVQLLVGNLLVDSGRLFLPGRVRRFYVNFPDPWFKRRHHNRRWLTRDSLAHLVTALERDGEVFFQSDVWELALEALALFEENDLLENVCGPWTFLRANPFGSRTEREDACIAGALSIWRLLYAKRPRFDEITGESYD
jgi:tRNA (guanine-N7-)-methyltransferase